MPVYNLICHFGHKKRVLRPGGWKSTDEKLLCKAQVRGEWCDEDCGMPLERDSGSVSTGTVVKEVIDNGAMVKSLERFADAERLHKDRVEIEDALAKGKDPGRKIR